MGKSTIAIVLLAVGALSGCGGDSGSSSTGSALKSSASAPKSSLSDSPSVKSGTPATTSASAVPAPSAPAASSGPEAGSSAAPPDATGAITEKVGIKECDDHIKAWNECYSDPQKRAAVEAPFRITVKGWQLGASNEAAKGHVAEQCKKFTEELQKVCPKK